MAGIDPNIPLGVRPVQIADPMQTLMQIHQMRSLEEHRRAQQEQWAQQQEERAERIAERREKLAGNEALDRATQVALNPDGTFNRQTMQSYLVNNGYGRFWPGIEKGLNEAEAQAATNAKTRGEVELQRRNTFGSAAATGLELPDELLMPWVQTNLAKMVQDQVITHDQAAKFLDDVPEDIEEVRTMLQLAVRNSPEQQRIINERAKPIVFGNELLDPTGTGVLRTKPKDYNLQSKNATATLPTGEKVTGLLNFDPDTGQYAPPGSTTPFPPGTAVVDAPGAVDPTVAAIREMTAAQAKATAAAGGLTPNQQATEVRTARDDWRRAILPIMERRGAVAKIDVGTRALEAGNRNASTQIIINAFNKLQDELSVVREGEYLRSEQGQSLLSRITGSLNKLALGGAKLTDAELKELATEAKNVATSVNAVHEEEIQNFRQSIEESLTAYSIPHTRVFGNSTIGQRKTDSGTGGAGAAPPVTTPPKTNPYR